MVEALGIDVEPNLGGDRFRGDVCLLGGYATLLHREARHIADGEDAIPPDDPTLLVNPDESIAVVWDSTDASTFEFGKAHHRVDIEGVPGCGEQLPVLESDRMPSGYDTDSALAQKLANLLAHTLTEDLQGRILGRNDGQLDIIDACLRELSLGEKSELIGSSPTMERSSLRLASTFHRTASSFNILLISHSSGSRAARSPADVMAVER